MPGNNKRSTRGIAVSGILLAASIVTLYIQTLLPVANFTVYMISSFYVSAVIIEAGPRQGMLFYVASCLLAFIFIPNKIFLIPYVLFFGIYGVIKYYIERLHRFYLEMTLKIIFFNVAFLILAIFFKELLAGSIALPDLPVAALIIGLEIAFLAYDYCYTLVIDIYNKRIKR